MPGILLILILNNFIVAFIFFSDSNSHAFANSDQIGFSLKTLNEIEINEARFPYLFSPQP